jgi:endonuclease/exonuclease/phosphatase family metal-dependent hydrolase
MNQVVSQPQTGLLRRDGEHARHEGLLVPPMRLAHRSLLVLAQAAAASAAKRLRLMTYNVHAWRDGVHVDNLERLIALVNEVQPDVLCLNEVLHPFAAPPPEHPYWEEVRSRHGHGLDPPEGSQPCSTAPEAYLNRFSSATGLPHLAYVAASETGSFFGAFPFGNAILSRHPLRDVQHRILQVSTADLTLGGQARTEADLEPRAALSARVELPGGGTLGVCSTHLDHKSEELRERQVSEAMELCAAAFKGDPHVLCGDLNTFGRSCMPPSAWEAVCAYYSSRGWPAPPEESLVLRRLWAGGYTDAYESWCRSCAEAAAAGSMPPPPPFPPLTCWSDKPFFRLDYVLLSRASDSAHGRRVRASGHRTIESPASDHFPVIVDLEVD